MKKLIILLAAGMAVLMLNFPAYATLGRSSGAYAGVNLGYGKAGSDHGIASILNVGYKYSQHFAIDGGVGLFPSDNYYIDAAAKIIMPLSIGYEVYGKVGAATNFSRIAPLFAIGGSYFFTPTLAANVEGSVMYGNDHDFKNMYAGMVGLTWFIN